MTTFFQNGMAKEIPYFLEDDSSFYIQRMDGTPVDQYIYPGDKMKYELDSELVALYDRLRDLFFRDTKEYYREISLLPIFVQEAGQDSECALTSEKFIKLLQMDEFSKIPNLYRHLYLVDCQFLVGAIQNLLIGLENSFVEYYIQISSIGNTIVPSSPNTVMIEMSPATSRLSSLLEVYFIKAYSILDMLCKIGCELEFPETDFTSYKKIKCADLLWGARKKLKINNTAHTLFEQCDLVSIIESLRNEVVHNGTWELNPKVFIKFEDENIVERFMLFPDISQGRLSTVKNRRHFFGNEIKVNDIFPKIHYAFKQRLLLSVELLNKI